MKTKLNKISSVLKRNRNQPSMLSVAMLSMLVSPAMAQKAADNSDIGQTEFIQVKGIAGSLAEAAHLKRFDGRIADAIAVEDIGKLPDNKIVEALQRITGVSITSDFGVGTSVSIRDLPQNPVEINGRLTVGDSRN